jgi:hypothetical protein
MEVIGQCHFQIVLALEQIPHQLNRRLYWQQSPSGSAGSEDSNFPLPEFQPQTLYPVAQSISRFP